MTTLSSERNRCTRISPSAVLDDRLEGKDLDWARDHLRRCDACRERVEDFREILLRVERLPSISVPASVVAEAFALSAPPALRPIAPEPSLYPFPVRSEKPSSDTDLVDLTSHSPRQEMAPAADMISELEREIFRDTPSWQKPPAAPSEPSVLEAEEKETRFHPAADEAAAVEDHPGFQPSLLEPIRFEQTEHQPPPPPFEPERFAPAMPLDNLRPLKQVELESSQRLAHAPVEDLTWNESEMEESERAEDLPADAERRPRADTMMRWAVALGAAACVVLAAILYETGGLLRGNPQKTATVQPKVSSSAAQSVRPSVAASTAPVAAPSVAPSVEPSTPAAPVVASLGEGYDGASVFQIRMGTADARFTRLVFDMRGGLPSMVITKPDDSHLVVTFKKTTGAGVPVNGLRSNRVSAVEPAVQQGPDLAITIDLARPVRPQAFTLPASGGYAYRLVLDLYSP
jgi:hypothetical protein